MFDDVIFCPCQEMGRVVHVPALFLFQSAHSFSAFLESVVLYNFRLFKLPVISVKANTFHLDDPTSYYEISNTFKREEIRKSLYFFLPSEVYQSFHLKEWEMLTDSVR